MIHLITVLSLILDSVYSNDPSSDKDSVMSFEQKDDLLRSILTLRNTPSPLSKDEVVQIGVRLSGLCEGEITDYIEEFEDSLTVLVGGV